MADAAGAHDERAVLPDDEGIDVPAVRVQGKDLADVRRGDGRHQGHAEKRHCRKTGREKPGRPVFYASSPSWNVRIAPAVAR